jgi:hypothetical protein
VCGTCLVRLVNCVEERGCDIESASCCSAQQAACFGGGMG